MLSKFDKNSVRQLWTNLSADGYIASDKGFDLSEVEPDFKDV